ncbi:MAG TPA: hypothetical protein VFO05_15220, partial [Candidatus Limnocylindrales bacterium]|nr:hypothetical protein [Candidatus Limnocylindrales bacterium]
GVSTGNVDELVDERILRAASPQVALDRDLWSVVRSSPEADVIRARYLDHFVAWARRADPHAIAEESRAIVYLLNWAVEGQRHHQALALNAATEPAFAATGRWGAWTRATEVALEASTKLGDEAGAARALNQLAVQALGDDADDKARNLLVQARDRATRAGATFEAAVAERNLRVIDGLPVPPPIERGHGGNGLPWAKIAGIGVIALLLGAVLLLLLRPQPALGIEPAAHAFGSTAAVSTGERVAFVVSNTGGTMLERLEVRLSSDVDGFRAISEDCEGRTLGPGETCTVEVVFVPSGPGEGQATLTVTARDGTSISAAITGSIVAPTPPSPTPPPPTDSPPPSPTPTETGLPDLAIRSFTPTGRPFRSDSWVIPVVVEIVNVGPAVSDRFEIVVTADGEPVPFDVPGEDPERLVTDGPFGPDDPPLAYRGNLLLDPQTPLSDVRLVVEADSCVRQPAPSPDCRIAEVERNQTNNSLELQAVDLQLSSLVVDEWRFQRVDPEATQSPYVDVNVAFDVVNAGTEDAGSFWIAASVGEILYPFMVVGDPGDDSDMLVQVPALASDDTLPITGVVAVPYELRDLRLDITAGCLAGSGECVLPEIAIENNTVSADIPQPPSVD